NQTAEEEEPSRIVHLKTFRSPSGNIGCALYEGGARCDIRKRDWSPPPRPAQCPKQTGYGQGVQVAHAGEAGFVCAADAAPAPATGRSPGAPLRSPTGPPRKSAARSASAARTGSPA